MQELIKYDEKDKEIFKLETSLKCLKNQYVLLQKNTEGMKSKQDILQKLKNEKKTHSDKKDNVYFYEEGKIDMLLWVLGMPPNTCIEAIEHELNEVSRL